MSFNWSRNSQWGLFLGRTGKWPPNFSSSVLARPSFSSLWCSREPEFIFSNRCFHASDFPLPPSCSRAPESLLSNRCSRALDFRLSPFAAFSCALLAPLLFKFLGARFSSFFLGVFAPLISHFSCVFILALISPLPLVFPRAWVSLPLGLPVCPNKYLSFTVSIPARLIHPFSLRILTCPIFPFFPSLGPRALFFPFSLRVVARPNFFFPFGVLAGLIFPFLILFSCARYFPSSFLALSFLAFSRARFSSFSDACHANVAVYRC